jgi:diguanylate cyclase (GGDEF)-like protein
LVSARIRRKLRFSLWTATIGLHGRPALVGAAVLTTLLALALFVSVLRAGRTRAPRRPPHGADRRRVPPAKRDPREALALVGNALAATHDARALTPLILEVITEATGARGGELIQGSEEIGWFGDVDKGEPLELVLTVGENAVDRTTLLLYPPRRGFRKETRTLAEWLASQAGIALENARLHERVQRQATTDELTGLVNRRRFLEALETELERARLFETPLSLLLADLDDFKRVNDAYGHLSGDDALRIFAGLLEAHLRKVDLAGRLGGEEFAVLLPETGLDEAALAANRMRAALSDAPLGLSNGAYVSLTASFGVAELVPGQSAQQLVSRADAALYVAKAAGKNRVSLADPVVEP